MDIQLKQQLLRLADLYETEEFLHGDPSWWMHQVEGHLNQEATAFVASALSYGSRSQFMPKIEHLLDLADGDMDRWIRKGLYEQHFTPGDKDCFYRLYNRDTMHTFFDAYRRLMNEHGSLGDYLSRNGSISGLQAVQLICRWFSSCGAGAVVPKDATSACKRVCMFLRWMVRTGSPVDLGLWSPFIDRRTLIMPLDTHVVSEAISLGLLTSRSASMNAAIHLTQSLAEVFPDDPLRGDFALFGYGVNKG